MQYTQIWTLRVPSLLWAQAALLKQNKNKKTDRRQKLKREGKGREGDYQIGLKTEGKEKEGKKWKDLYRKRKIDLINIQKTANPD